MKIKLRSSLRGFNRVLLASACALSLGHAIDADASTDYGPAVWKANCGQFYTSGDMHQFQVLHSLEGYYLATITYYQNCSTAASLHYLVNGKQDTSTDSAAGETTQMVREAYWAWQANCWAKDMFGTGHEGFRNNPAWLTTPLYTESAALTRHLCDTWSFGRDRNHIISDDKGSDSTWVTWLASHYPSIDPSCNSTGAGMGSYFDWTKYMNYVKGTIVDDDSAGFSASANWLVGSDPNAHNGDYHYHTAQPISDLATWTTTTLAGKYEVAAWWPQASNHSAAAPYLISTKTGTQTIYANQGVNGGQWNTLGTFTLASGTNTVQLSCWAPTGFVVIADAVRWQKVSDF